METDSKMTETLELANKGLKAAIWTMPIEVHAKGMWCQPDMQIVKMQHRKPKKANI